MIHNNNKKNEQNPDEVEVEIEMWFRIAVKTAFPLRYQQPLVEIATKAIDVVKNLVGIDLMNQVLESVRPSSFGRFFAALGLRDLFCPKGVKSQAIQDFFGNLDHWLQRTEGSADTPLEWFVDVINKNENDRLILSVSEFLALSKDDLLNDFVIPNYRVSRRFIEDERDEMDIQVLLESAFDRMVLKRFPLLFDSEPSVIYDRLEEFDINDAKSVFEYYIEQDEVLKDRQDLREFLGEHY
jgi:hypothetical protein